MQDHDETPEVNGEKLDRKSILRSTVPKRKGQMRDLVDTNHKFHELIQYYECLDHRSLRAAKGKNTVCSSVSTTPDLAEYESGSTGSRSSATPDLLFAKPSSLNSDLDSRTNSPDFGYCSKRSSRRYKDRHDEKMKKSDSPDLGYGTTPEKGPFKSYADMRYLLDLKNPSSSDSESNSIPKAHANSKTYDYTDCLGLEKIGLDSDETSVSKRSSFCIEEFDPEFTNLENFTFEVKLGASRSHSRQMESLEKRIGNVSLIMEQADDTLKNKCFDEQDSDSPSSIEKDTLNYTNPFEYEAPNNLESDYARYKLAFDITESDFSTNLNTSRIKRSSQSSTDGYDDFVKDSGDTIVGNSQDFEYDGILNSILNENYAARAQSQQLVPEIVAKSGSSMSQYYDLKLDEYKAPNDEEKSSHQVTEIEFPDNMFTMDYEQVKDEDLKKSPDSMFSFACEAQPGSRISNLSAGVNVDKETAEEKIGSPHASASEEAFDLSNLTDQVQSDSRLSETYYGFGMVKIAESYKPSTSPRLDYMSEPRSRYSMINERTNRGPAEIKRLSLDCGALTKPEPHYMDNQFGTYNWRYSLPKPSDFLSDSFVKRKQSHNQSLNLSSEPMFKVGPLNKSTDSEMKANAMRNFMSSCMNETAGDVSLAESTASSIPPALPSQPPPSLDESANHKMKIDLHTVDYIMNNRRRSCLNKNANVLKDESSLDEHNYSIVSLIGALEELGIEVEFNEPDEQHRRRTIGRNTSMMESVIEEENEEKTALEQSESKLNEIKEADEVIETPGRLVHKPEDKTFRLECPSSPVLSSSKKLKFLQRRPTGACKANINNMIEPEKHDLESTRKLFIDSEDSKICKLDNSISTISMTTSASREVSPTTTESLQQKITAEHDLAPINLSKVLNAEEHKQSTNSEFDKIERYAKASALRTDKVEKKLKSNSFSSKFPRLNRKSKQTTTVESIPSVVENFLTDALGSEKDHYETTMVDDTFANTNDIDSSLFTADESATVDLDRSLRRSISDITSSAKAHLKNPSKKSKSSRRRWSELQEEMHVLLDSVSKQQLMIQQASKALKMCYSFKEFENSEEHVESERILLLAHKRKSAAMDAINEFSQKPNRLVYDSYGNISLKNIILPLNSSYEKYDKKNDSVEWYMVVVQNGLTVLASQPVMRHKNTNEIQLSDLFCLPKVNPDFKLTFEIYRLKLKKKGGISHELKYHIRGSYSLADAWYKAISKLTQRSNSYKQNNIRLTKMFESSFMLIGQMQLSLKDLSQSSPWNLQQAHPILEGTVNMSFCCNVDLTESNAGWLTHGTDLKGYTVWNRRWCVLLGHVLKFWDYPTDDPEEKPIMQLDLIHCIHSEIGVVDREFCAKPRTIMFRFDQFKNLSDYDVTSGSNIREQRHFLTLDTNKDLEEWLKKINGVLQALKSWNAK